MIALIASILLVSYVFIPGVVFRVVFSSFIPLRKYQRSRTEEVTFAVIASLIPFLLAVGLVYSVEQPFGKHPFYFEDTWAQRRADYKFILAASNSEEVFRNNQEEFWNAITRSSRRQGRVIVWYYLLIVAEAFALGKLSKSYGRLYRYKTYAWLADKFLLPTISEWHVLLTPFSLPPEPASKVDVNVLTSEDHLYRGEVRDYFIDVDGNLTGILLKETSRFDRRRYLKDEEEGKKPDAKTYWKPIPGAKLYIAADKIVNLNVGYQPTEPVDRLQRVRELLNKLKIGDAKIEIIKMSEKRGSEVKPQKPESAPE